MIGATGFEPATSASRTQRSAKLSYAPIKAQILAVFLLPVKEKRWQDMVNVTPIIRFDHHCHKRETGIRYSRPLIPGPASASRASRSGP